MTWHVAVIVRTVSCLDSYTDSDGGYIADMLFDTSHHRWVYREEDTKWSVHVWNEAWFKRVDLPDGNVSPLFKINIVFKSG